ncbi:hypothetical protein M3Y98_00300700 [Aphelenchoides besseyi]|nr:hypothetical protein M3Y98_00300700 [Aphelenchoides besseyi]KAI6201226.1 hypothetical protein M3Y96_00819100 [Aphelenchoides besseyi]
MWDIQTFRRIFQLFDRFLWTSINGYEKFIVLGLFFIDICFGSPFYRTFVGLAFGPISSTIFTLVVGIALLIYFDFFRPQQFSFKKFYNKWSNGLEKRSEFANLSRSFHHSDLSLSFGSLINYKHSFDASTTIENVSKSQNQSANNSADRQRLETEENVYSSMNSLLSQKSPYSKTIFTEGHYTSFEFSDRNDDVTIDDLSVSSRSGWNGRDLKISQQTNYSMDFSNKSMNADDQQTSAFKSSFTAPNRSKSTDDPLLEHLFSDKNFDYFTSPTHTHGKSPSKTNSDSSKTDKEDGKRGRLSRFSFSNARIHHIAINDPVYLDLMRYSVNLKLFISKNLWKPLLTAMNNVNQALADNHATFSIDNGNVEMLQMALEQKPELRLTKIPYLIPYLRVHANQAYLVHRIRQLTRNFVSIDRCEDRIEALPSYSSDTSKTTNGWNVPELSNSELIFKLFCVYLDTSTAKRCLVNDPEKPFSSIYVLKEPAEPSVVQKLPNSFYIYVRTKDVVTFDFVTNGGVDLYTVAPGEDNVFISFVLLLLYCKQHNRGYIGDMRLDDLLSVID